MVLTSRIHTSFSLPAMMKCQESNLFLALNRNWTKYMKSLFSDTEQQTVQDCEAKKRKTNEMSPPITLVFCQKACVRPGHAKQAGRS